MITSDWRPADNENFGSSVYEDGKFVGEYVEKLTDGPTTTFEKSAPMGRFGDRQNLKSRAIDSFQRELQNAKLYWGVREVWHRKFGSVEQVLTRSIDGSLAWVNV